MDGAGIIWRFLHSHIQCLTANESTEHVVCPCDLTSSQDRASGQSDFLLVHGGSGLQINATVNEADQDPSSEVTECHHHHTLQVKAVPPHSGEETQISALSVKKFVGQLKKTAILSFPLKSTPLSTQSSVASTKVKIVFLLLTTHRSLVNVSFVTSSVYRLGNSPFATSSA